MFNLRRTSLARSCAAVALLGTIALAAPRSAHASGITLGRFEGIFGHPNTDGGLALYGTPLASRRVTGSSRPSTPPS